MTTSNSLYTYISNLTTSPGIYKMLDVQGTVLYVGKASNLKKRISSYFSKTQKGAKTQSLVSQIHAIEVVVTSNAKEALLLESTVIKTLRPKYNVLLRDDKTYPYIQVSDHIFPRIDSYRSKKKPQKGHYFGPFPSAGLVRETLIILQKVFKLRTCKDSFFNARSRPCLQYQINRCTAPCVNYVSKENYQKQVEHALKFLQGKSSSIISELMLQMEEAISHLAFEEAAIYRDQIKNLQFLQERQHMVQLSGDLDVIVMEVREAFACVLCVTVREGQVIANQSYFPTLPKEQIGWDDLEQQVLDAFVSHYYLDNPVHIPPLILLDRDFPDLSITEALLQDLRKKRCRVSINPKGKQAQTLRFAKANLDVLVEQTLNSTENRAKRFEAVRVLLDLPTPISRIECFDISHTQGQDTTASCVVFDQNGACKREYRHFTVRNIKPGDDYAAISQAVSRRYKRLIEEGKLLPDLVIIDGGKGQLAAAQKALHLLNPSSMPFLIGIAKGILRKPGLEQLFLVTPKKECQLLPDSQALHLFQQIRDEAHRFAVKGHRKKRGKTALESSLLSIEGIGMKRRQTLMHHFGGIQSLKNASIEEIAKVPGVSLELARRVYNQLKLQ